MPEQDLWRTTWRRCHLFLAVAGRRLNSVLVKRSTEFKRDGQKWRARASPQIARQTQSMVTILCSVKLLRIESDIMRDASDTRRSIPLIGHRIFV
ncbi:hypothetical protein AG1IA_01091 [Rhizoctonia solani AG-1 IA]|uniref:Uncharacterized protein n=1 Tax=Thanatephorus cucumeris (strain AG1-IA) TaxID=983506 RepID=L8X709_THACA|nr:hypothetical protein AG1IA_01091 [Rhizoctonia solani AG-1 IA]